MLEGMRLVRSGAGSAAGSAARAFSLALAVGLAVAFAPASALAFGEEITDIRVLGNQRTDESTIRSIAGISIGDTLEADTLDMVRERLHTRGLFADVNVWWEPHGRGVRVNISVTDKFPWAPVPTGSFSSNNWALGVVFVHGNLFGRGKQLLLGGRIAKIDSGIVAGYRDPSLFGSWMYWQMQGFAQRLVLPEYDNGDTGTVDANLADPIEFRETRLLSFGFEPSVGIAWFRRVKTQVAWHLERVDFDSSYNPANGQQMEAATAGGVIGVGRASLSFDFRAREFAVMTGAALSGSFDYATPSFGSDFTYWKAGASWEHGIKVFRSHNFVYFLGATAGHNLPFFAENNAGGTNLRGYLFQQFRGDTQLGGKVEYHFPLFSIGSLDFRALGFYDVQAVWFREPPPTVTVTGPDGGQYLQRQTPDYRTFALNPNSVNPVPIVPFGFSFKQNVHNDVGGGLRFFLRSVAVPLVGFDAGYGIESGAWKFILIVGA
jgi:outer membrane protein assembly factor BamA